MASAWGRVTDTSVQRRHALTATTHFIRTRARPMATTVRNGLSAVCSSAPALGITAITGTDTVTIDGVIMATTVAATIDPALMHTTEAVDLVMGEAMHAAQLVAASMGVDAGDRPN